MNRIVLAVLFALLQACATQSAVQKKSTSIGPGMSAAQVREILGDPENRQFQGRNEAWQYCSTGAITDHFVIVWFYAGVVSGMQTYQNQEQGMCDSFFRSINWEDAPDTTVEVRQR